jgi:hypothetical protein
MSEYLPFSTQEDAYKASGLNPENPAMTYVDFANKMAENSTNQQKQEQMVQQAIEMTKQQKMKTQQGQEASDKGINPEMKGYLSVQEAVAQMEAAGVDEGQIQAFVTSLGDQQMVSQAAVDTVLRKKELAVKPGTPFIASDADAKNESIVTKEGDQLVSGQSYYDTGDKDQDGNAIYAHGGKEPVDQEGKLALKDQQLADKQWTDLNKELNKFIRSSRGNALTQAVQRAVRALNELGEGQPLTSQMLSFIQKDVSGIFTGGVPPISGMEAEDFTNTLQKVNHFIAKYTGVQGYLYYDLGDQRQYLLGLLMRLRQSTTDMLKASLASNAEGYRTIIDKNPEQWQKIIADKMAAVESGLSSNAQTTLDAMKESPAGNLPPAMAPTGTSAAPNPSTTPVASGGPDIHALASALGLKRKVQ